MTMQIFIPHSNFNAGSANASRFEVARNFILGLYVAWKRERIRKANLRFVMGLDPIVLRDLGYTREEISARHDGPLPISRWKSSKPRA